MKKLVKKAEPKTVMSFGWLKPCNCKKIKCFITKGYGGSASTNAMNTAMHNEDYYKKP